MHIYIYLYYIYIYRYIIYVIMKTMCPPGYHHNGFALWQLMHLGTNHTSCAQVHEVPQSHCGDNREGTLFS